MKTIEIDIADLKDNKELLKFFENLHLASCFYCPEESKEEFKAAWDSVENSFKSFSRETIQEFPDIYQDISDFINEKIFLDSNFELSDEFFDQLAAEAKEEIFNILGSETLKNKKWATTVSEYISNYFKTNGSFYELASFIKKMKGVVNSSKEEVAAIARINSLIYRFVSDEEEDL